MLGWATWKAAKGIAKYQKAKKSIPTPTKKTSKKKKAGKVIAGAAAAAGVTAMIKRKRKHGGDYHAPDSSSE
jgi:hypothetical protein